MSDPGQGLSVAEIAVRHGARVRGEPDTRVTGVATLANAGPGDITFLANPRYRRYLAQTRASAVILGPADAKDCPVSALVHDNPYALYARVAADLHPVSTAAPGVAASAVVDPGAEVDSTASVGACAVVETGAQIGARAHVGPGCVVGAGAVVGADTRLVANVTLCHGVRLGERVIVHPGAVIGADGFGIAQTPEGWLKVPQVGSVVIGDDVEIGASTTIDRGAVEDTVVEEGVKLDNQIQVAHNVRIGAHTVIAACTGISGSTVIGRRCMIAGAVGFVGHLTIADDVVITGQTMVNRSIEEAGAYSSALPMDDARRWRRNSARFRQLDDMAKRLRRLEKAMTKKGGDGDD